MDTDGVNDTQHNYRLLFLNMESAFALCEVVSGPQGGKDFRYVEVNPAFCRITGASETTILGTTIGASGRLGVELWLPILTKVAETGVAFQGETQSSSTGQWFSAHCYVPTAGFVAVLFSDVTERRTLEQRQRESERQLRIIFDNTGTSNSIFDLDCRLVRQNAVSVAQLGVPEDRARHLHVTELFGAEKGRMIEERMRHVLATGGPEAFETRFHLPTGEKRFRSSYQPLFDEGEVIGVQIVSQDITEQVRAQEALREHDLQFRTFFELAADLVCISGMDGVFRQINPAGQALLKYDEKTLLSRPFLDFVVPEDRERTVQVTSHQLAQGETVIQFENRYRCGDGSVVVLEWVSRPDVARELVYAVARDVTARRRFEAEREAIEAQIRKTQRLESLGILAGGIAHDFNNILAGILGFVELANLKTSDGTISRYLQKIEDGCVRAQGLTRQLLTFAKGGVPVLKVVDPGELVESSVHFASHGTTSTIVVRREPGLPLISCDPDQIGQVVSNLVINALQAMEGAGSLEVAVTAGESGVVCRFTDTGPGIPATVIDHIFDPFFTTKKSGTGLGLSICHSIVQNHHGTLSVDSVPGAGTTFTLRLPSAIVESLPTVVGPSQHRGQGRALVLDDEESIRTSVAEILTTFGYQAEPAGTSAQFEALLDGPPPVLCLLDLTVPGRQGGALWARDLRNQGYRGRLVAMSGYSHDPVLAQPGAYGFDGALAKPFRAAQLAGLLETLGPTS